MGQLLAHGGTGGLLVEIVPVAAIVAIGLVVWTRSRRAGGSEES